MSCSDQHPSNTEPVTCSSMSFLAVVSVSLFASSLAIAADVQQPDCSATGLAAAHSAWGQEDELDDVALLHVAPLLSRHSPPTPTAISAGASGSADVMEDAPGRASLVAWLAQELLIEDVASAGTSIAAVAADEVNISTILPTVAVRSVDPIHSGSADITEDAPQYASPLTLVVHELLIGDAASAGAAMAAAVAVEANISASLSTEADRSVGPIKLAISGLSSRASDALKVPSVMLQSTSERATIAGLSHFNEGLTMMLCFVFVGVLLTLCVLQQGRTDTPDYQQMQDTMKAVQAEPVQGANLPLYSSSSLLPLGSSSSLPEPERKLKTGCC